MYDEYRALQLLRLGTGNPGAEFRVGQNEAVRHVVENRGRLLVVQKTGWGKSFVYFIATKLLREAGSGPALLVSPLLSLMRNQISAAQRMGVNAVTINSSNRKQWAEIERAIADDEIDILLISPERFANEEFRSMLAESLASRVAMLIVDEAHCISDWGHDFRPSYRLIERFLRTLPRNLRVLATTATANRRVQQDLEDVLGPNLTISRGDLARPTLRLQTIHLPKQSERLAWLAEHVPRLPGSGIIYALTIDDANDVARWLRQHGLAVQAYTSRSANREDLEQDLIDERVKALVATTALSMGFDKPDLGFVIHFQVPGSVVAYYQQVGRAGRGLDTAYGILLGGDEDTDITDYFIQSAFPTRDEVAQVLSALEMSGDGLTLNDLQRAINLSRSRIDKTLDLLSLESPAPVVQEEKRWVLTSTPVPDSFWRRVTRLTTIRRAEQRQMWKYLNLDGGHMEFLIDALDGEPGDTPLPPAADFPVRPDAGRVRDAERFLRRVNLTIEPRISWPVGGFPEHNLTGRIPSELRFEPGRVLCRWGDEGWGDLVKAGKYREGAFSNELVAAAADMVREWSPDPFPAWVSCIPSSRHQSLVPDFAKRLAHELRLPFRTMLERIEARPEQKLMANSAQALQNVLGSFGVRPGKVPPLPVLLVDDIVDSRWTMTVAAYLLRGRGCGPVIPFALASAAVWD